MSKQLVSSPNSSAKRIAELHRLTQSRRLTYIAAQHAATVTAASKRKFDRDLGALSEVVFTQLHVGNVPVADLTSIACEQPQPMRRNVNGLCDQLLQMSDRCRVHINWNINNGITQTIDAHRALFVMDKEAMRSRFIRSVTSPVRQDLHKFKPKPHSCIIIIISISIITHNNPGRSACQLLEHNTSAAHLLAPTRC